MASSGSEDTLKDVIMEKVNQATTGAKTASTNTSGKSSDSTPAPASTHSAEPAKTESQEPPQSATAPAMPAQEKTSTETHTMKESDSDKKSTAPTAPATEVAQHEVDTIPVGPILIIAGFLFIWAAGYVQNRISNDKQFNRIKAIETKLEEKVSTESLEALQGRASTAESRAAEAMKASSDTKKEVSSIKSALSKKADSSVLSTKADTSALEAVSNEVSSVKESLDSKAASSNLDSVKASMITQSDLDRVAAAKADLDWVKDSMAGVAKAEDVDAQMSALKSDISEAGDSIMKRLEAVEAALREMKAQQANTNNEATPAEAVAAPN